MKKAVIFVLTLVMLLSVFSGFASAAEKAYPERDIELVVPFAAGGGSALTGQTIAQIMTEEKIIPVNMNLSYKPGGSMSVGMAYTAAKRGDPYCLMLFTPMLVTTPLISDTGISVDDLSVICVFGYEVSVLMTNPDSPFQTFDDVVAYAKEHPGELTVGNADTEDFAYVLIGH